MAVLKEEEWIFLNEIIHVIYNIQNMEKMRMNLLELLSTLIPNAASSFYVAENGMDRLLGNPVAINITRNDITNYLGYGQKLDYTLPIFKNGLPYAYKETDLFDNDLREKTDFFNQFLAHGFEYPAALCIADHGVCYGALSLFRSKKMGDFCDRDIFILNQLQKHLSTRLALENAKEKTALDYSAKLMQLEDEFHLTAREMEIVNFIFQGFSNEEISRLLFIEAGTVKKHIHNIYGKLAIRNRANLMKFLI